jgi:uncharacterized membrane protein YeaQ/YmgE (transglycosylase-associated protein family)
MPTGLVEFVVLAVVAAIAGAIGEALAGYSLGGCVVSAVIGYVGALIGFFLETQLHIVDPLNITIAGDNKFPFLLAVICSLVLTLILGGFKRRRNRRPLVY